MDGTVEAVPVTGSDQGRIPVLDIGPVLAGERGACAALAHAVARTCEDTGFLVIDNHGIAPALVANTFAEAARFFALPTEKKLALTIGQYNIGYLPFGGQTVRHSPVNRNTKPNFSESFYITRDRAPDHHIMEVGNDEVGVMNVDVHAKASQEQSCQTADGE